MVSLAGLSAVYPGQQQAERQYQSNRLTQEKVDDAVLDREGAAALGRTFAALSGQQPGGMPPGGMPQGPQPPMPGQSSQPMQQPNQMAGPPSGVMPGQQPGMTGAPPSGTMPQPQQRVAGPQGIPQPQGQFDLQTAAQTIAKTNPGIRPEVLVHALGKAMPYLNAQAQMQVRQLMMDHRERMLETREQGLNERGEARNATRITTTQMNVGQRDRATEQRAATATEAETGRNTRTAVRDDTARRGQDLNAETRANAETGRQGRFDRREAYRVTQDTIRNDQRWQQLDVARQEAQRKLQSGDQRQGLSEWRAVVDAQHKRALEIIQSYRDMPTKDRDELRRQIDSQYESQITAMRDSRPSGTARPTAAPKPAAPAKDQAQVTPPGAAAGPPPEALEALKKAAPGSVLKIGDQRWTLENGQLKQVP